MSMSSSFSCFAFFFSAIFLSQSLHYFVIIIYFYMFSWCLPISNIIISACSLVLPISNIILLPVLWKMIRAFQADRRTKVRHSVLKGSYYGPDGIRTRNTRLKRPMLLAYVFSIHYQVELRARRLGREFRNHFCIFFRQRFLRVKKGCFEPGSWPCCLLPTGPYAEPFCIVSQF